MRNLSALLFAALFAATPNAAARADILINVDKSAQRLTVSEDGRVLYDWPVSTGKTGYATPSGSFRAFRMEADHYSREWDDAPMPYSIFFTKKGHAIHGTTSKGIGTPVSHGCVRLSVAHAEKLYALVQKDGVLKTRVVLTGSEQVALKRERERLATRGKNRDKNRDNNKERPAQQQEAEAPPRQPASPYVTSPYGASTYRTSPYGTAPYGNSPYAASPYESSPPPRYGYAYPRDYAPRHQAGRDRAERDYAARRHGGARYADPDDADSDNDDREELAAPRYRGRYDLY